MLALLTPGQTLGGYVVERFMGVGQLTEVWQVRRGKQPFVVKRLHDHLAADRHQLDRFVDEAELAHRLHHPNLCRVVEVSNHRGIWFLVMEFVDGSEWPPPANREVVGWVKEWKTQIAKRPAPVRHAPGTYGQLESTEAVMTSPPNLKPRRPMKGEAALGKTVLVPHQTDYTEAVTAPALRALDDDAMTEQLPSVMVDPTLERRSARAAPPPKKRKRAR